MKDFAGKVLFITGGAPGPRSRPGAFAWFT